MCCEVAIYHMAKYLTLPCLLLCLLEQCVQRLVTELCCKPNKLIQQSAVWNSLQSRGEKNDGIMDSD